MPSNHLTHRRRVRPTPVVSRDRPDLLVGPRRRSNTAARVSSPLRPESLSLSAADIDLGRRGAEPSGKRQASTGNLCLRLPAKRHEPWVLVNDNSRNELRTGCRSTYGGPSFPQSTHVLGVTLHGGRLAVAPKHTTARRRGWSLGRRSSLICGFLRSTCASPKTPCFGRRPSDRSHHSREGCP